MSQLKISIPNCKALQNIPYTDFWQQVENIKTPIIEPNPEDENSSRVTFLYKGNNIKNVVLSTYGALSYDPHYDQLHHYPETDIYYRTYTFPNDTRTVYCFTPNDPLISLAEFDLYDLKLLNIAANWQLDIFNPNIYEIPGWLIFGNEAKNFSLLELPKAPKPQSCFNPINNDNSGKITTHFIESKLLKQKRKFYVYTPHGYDGSKSYPWMLFFDGEAYIEYVTAVNILDNLIADNKIPPVVATFISNLPPNPETRFADYSFNENYFNYIATELFSWMQQNYSVSSFYKNNVAVGHSLGGVAATYMANYHNNVIGNVVSQSGAYFWYLPGQAANCFLISEVVKNKSLDANFYLDVGTLENALSFAHGPTMVNVNRHFRDVLIAKECKVKYVEYHGGHDYICWRDTLPKALIDIFA